MQVTKGPFVFDGSFFVRTEKGWWRSDDEGTSWYPAPETDLTATIAQLREDVARYYRYVQADHNVSISTGQEARSEWVAERNDAYAELTRSGALERARGGNDGRD